MLYTLWVYEVWGNAKEGYTVNDRMRIDKDIHLPKNITDAQLIKAAKNYGLLSNLASTSNIDIEGDEYFYTFSDADTGEPLGEFTAQR